jgi:hypothetical protein
MKERFNPEKKKGLVTCSFGSLIGNNRVFLISIYMPTPPFWFSPIVFSFGGRVPIRFYVPGYVFDSVSFRPLGSAAFSHYGDKVRRKTTLVIALLTISTEQLVLWLCEHRNRCSFINVYVLLAKVLV